MEAEGPMSLCSLSECVALSVSLGSDLSASEYLHNLQIPSQFAKAECASVAAEGEPSRSRLIHPS